MADNLLTISVWKMEKNRLIIVHAQKLSDFLSTWYGLGRASSPDRIVEKWWEMIGDYFMPDKIYGIFIVIN